VIIYKVNLRSLEKCTLTTYRRGKMKQFTTLNHKTFAGLDVSEIDLRLQILFLSKVEITYDDEALNVLSPKKGVITNYDIMVCKEHDKQTRFDIVLSVDDMRRFEINNNGAYYLPLANRRRLKCKLKIEEGRLRDLTANKKEKKMRANSLRGFLFVAVFVIALAMFSTCIRTEVESWQKDSTHSAAHR